MHSLGLMIIFFSVSVSVDLHNVPTTPLRRYVRKATPTGRELGSGTYGSVIELVSAGEVVAGKVFKNSHMQPVLGKLYGEMILMMSIHHPNIVESRGVCFLEHPMPVLLMERLESSLHAYLLDPSHQDMKLTAKVSILHDVASGLSYLHNQKPAIIHRDLTARNVLLDSKLKAKIGDFGNARLMDLDPATTPETFTNLPGTLEYMPPGAFGDHVKYDPSLDVFSFGHLALFTVIQSHVALLSPNYIQGEKIISRPEVTRRQESMKRAEQVLGKEHTLVELISYCLHNNTALRPHTEKIVATLQQVIKGIVLWTVNFPFLPVPVFIPPFYKYMYVCMTTGTGDKNWNMQCSQRLVFISAIYHTPFHSREEEAKQLWWH